MRAQPAPRSPLPRAALSEFQNEAADGGDDLTIDRDREVQSEAPIVMLPLHGSADPYVARYETYPEDRKDRIRTAMGITLLAIAGLGLGLWGYWLFETSADPNAPATVAQTASQKAPQPVPAPESTPPAAVVPDPTTNPTPTARAPQVPARQAASTATATPAPDAGKTATPVAPPVRPVAPPAPVTSVAPPAAPKAISPDRAPQAPQRQSPPVATVPAPVVGTPAAAAPRSEKPASPPPSQQAAVSAASTGGLFAITRPIGAQVFLDDKLIGTTPLFLSGVADGRHAIRLELSGYKPYTSSIDIKPNERFRVAAQLEQ